MHPPLSSGQKIKISVGRCGSHEGKENNRYVYVDRLLGDRNNESDCWCVLKTDIGKIYMDEGRKVGG